MNTPSAAPGTRAQPDGRRVYRIDWVPGTDRLRAVCHCNAERVFEDPVALWEWLVGHPSGHASDAR